jgi:hypothetical protein
MDSKAKVAKATAWPIEKVERLRGGALVEPTTDLLRRVKDGKNVVDECQKAAGYAFATIRATGG